MKNADEVSRRRSLSECGTREDGLAGAIVLLMIVFGGTQLLLAQHNQGDPNSAARRGKSHVAQQRGGGGSLASADDRKHWIVEPSCFNDGSNNVPDRGVSRSWVLTSPDGRYKAYAINEAIAERSSDGELSGCKSTSRLFVTAPGSEQVKPVLVVEPVEGASGNSIELVDWSRDGHRLVVIEGFGQWASDAGGTVVRVYDADSDKVSDEHLFYEASRRFVGRECVGTFDPIGFSPHGKVVVTAYPGLDEEQILQDDSCVKKMEIWELDLATAKLQRLRNDYKVQRYGKRGF